MSNTMTLPGKNRVGQHYTQVAAQAVSLAGLFSVCFAGGLEGPVRFRVELKAPDGPSTGAGKQALQHLTLVRPDGGPAIVIGSVDGVRQVVEIRTFEHVAALYAQRFHGAEVPVTASHYSALCERLVRFFRVRSMQASFASLDRSAIVAAARSLSTPPPASGGDGLWTARAIGALAGLAILGVAFCLIGH